MYSMQNFTEMRAPPTPEIVVALVYKKLKKEKEELWRFFDETSGVGKMVRGKWYLSWMRWRTLPSHIRALRVGAHGDERKSAASCRGGSYEKDVEGDPMKRIL